MEFNKYYQDELTYLRELGAEFSRYYPKLAPFLGAESHDPDVERLLEGFAFLTGRIRQKLDDELPELSEGLFSLLWPHFLRPLPSIAVMQFTPEARVLSDKKTVKQGTELDSEKISGTSCRFRTCFDVDVYPIEVTSVDHRTHGKMSSIEISMSTVDGINLSEIDLSILRFFVGGENKTANEIIMWLSEYVKQISVSYLSKSDESINQNLTEDCIKFVARDSNEAIIPFPDTVLSGYRQLQEYFAFPQKNLFFDVSQLDTISWGNGVKSFKLKFEFSQPFSKQIQIKKEHFLLFCTPSINLFERGANPIRVDRRKMEYRLQVNAEERSHYDIFQISDVVGTLPGNHKRKHYFPFVDYHHALMQLKNEDQATYTLHRKPAAIGDGIDLYIGLSQSAESIKEQVSETISIQLICTNNRLAEKLEIGDIHLPTGSTPEFVTCANITKPTRSFPPPINRGLHWLLISNMSLNYESLGDINALKAMLSTYNFSAFYDGQASRINDMRMDSIESINVESINLMILGAPIRGLRITLCMSSKKYGNAAEMYIFARTIESFFALFASINSFVQVWVEDTEKGEVYQWPPRNGHQRLI